MKTEIFIILIMGIIIIARILIEVLCRQTKYHARAACIVGLFACYTGLLISAVFWLNKYVITKSVTTLEYSHYVCVMILGMNIACVFLFLLYYYASKRRKLTEKEKIILKDLEKKSHMALFFFAGNLKYDKVSRNEREAANEREGTVSGEKIDTSD